MKQLFLIHLICLLSLLPGTAQTGNSDANSPQLIGTVFDQMEAQGVNTGQPLLYGYFFYDTDRSKLVQLKEVLLAQSYRLVVLEKRGGTEYLLHVEKTEQHTRQSLFERGKQLIQLAAQSGVALYDGFDVGNSDPSRPLVTNAGFNEFMLSKKGDALFDLGIRLYNLEIYDKAKIVLHECIRQQVKPDTSMYKLANLLVDQDSLDAGIRMLEAATRFNPGYLKAFFNLGALCYSARQIEKSLLYYQQADRLSPGNDATLYGIAAAQYVLKQYDQSLANCNKALEINRNNQNAKRLLEMLKGKAN